MIFINAAEHRPHLRSIVVSVFLAAPVIAITALPLPSLFGQEEEEPYACWATMPGVERCCSCGITEPDPDSEEEPEFFCKDGAYIGAIRCDMADETCASEEDDPFCAMPRPRAGGPGGVY